MNVRRRTLLLAPWLVLLAGCTSIPLGTLWKMRDFGKDDLAAIDPQALRVAGLVEPGPLLDPARSVLTLTLTLTPEQGPPERHAFGLRNARLYSAQLVPAGDPRWQIFELDDTGRAEMRRLLPILDTIEERHERFAFDVKMQMAGDLPADVDMLRMSIRVQLAAGQEPLVLLDRAPMPIERDGK